MTSHLIPLAVEDGRPLTDWVRQTFGLDPDGFAVRALDALVEPALQIAVILVVAGVVASLLRRAVRRAVDRAKDPEAPRARRLRAKVGLVEEGRPQFSERRAQRVDALAAVAFSAISVVVWVIALFMVLGTFGINLGPLIAGAGIVGVAVGFGAQSLVRDFLSGMFMLLEDQYGVGDIIDAGDAVGIVEGVTLRTTRIRDVEGTLWHVPNGEIHRIGNMSQEWARALLDVAVAYGTDVDAASELIERVAVEMAGEDEYRELFIEDPAVWGVQELGDDSVDIRLVIKVVPGQQWAIARELRRRIKNAFDEAEVEIPFPQRTVWLRTEQPVALGGADAQPFDHPVPDEPTMQRAVAASKRGDTGAARTTAELVPEEDEVSDPGEGEAEEPA